MQLPITYIVPNQFSSSRKRTGWPSRPVDIDELTVVIVDHVIQPDKASKVAVKRNPTAVYLPEKQHHALNKAAKIVMAMYVRRSRFQQYVTKHLVKQNECLAVHYQVKSKRKHSQSNPIQSNPRRCKYNCTRQRLFIASQMYSNQIFEPIAHVYRLTN